MIAATPTGLAAAFEQSHSALFDLSSDAPSVKALAEYRDKPLEFMIERLGIPKYRLVWSMNPGYADANGIFQRPCPDCDGKLNKAARTESRCPTCDGVGRIGWDGTPDPLVAILSALRDSHDCCVESATGTGKSFLCACIVLWFQACWEGARVFTFAGGNEDQLRNYMWKEIRELWPRFHALFPSAVLLDLRIRMRGGLDDSWGALGVAVKKRAGEEVAVGAQGMHAPHMLLVYEEMPGMDMATVLAGENTCTAPHNIRLGVGNPDHQLDALHQFGYDEAGKPRPNMVCVRISALDHPNYVCNDAEIVPGAVSVKSVNGRRIKYTPKNRLYTSRVRGLSPAEAEEALIKREWVERAIARWKDPEARALLSKVGKERRSLGVDVANSEGGDEAAIADGLGAVLETLEAFACPNANNLGFQVHLRMQERHIDDDLVGIDGVGVGAGAVNELYKRERHGIQNLLGSAKPRGGVKLDGVESEDFNNLRSEIHWTLREDLRLDLIALPPDDEMVRDLITPTWEPKNGKIVVESKETLSARLPGGRSPNKGDAVAYWNYVRPRDPVVTELKKPKAPSIRERVMKELQSLDETPQQAKRYFGTMRQG